MVAVGENKTLEFPALTRTMFVRYAGASGDFNPMHHDDTIAAQVGNPSVFGHGMLSMGLAARVVKDWFGPEAMRVLKVRFAKQVWPGDVLTCVAIVTAKRDAARTWINTVNASDAVHDKWGYLLASETVIKNASAWAALRAGGQVYQ